MMKEAEAVFERIVKEFGGMSSQGDRLGKAAFTELQGCQGRARTRSATCASASPHRRSPARTSMASRSNSATTGARWSSSLSGQPGAARAWTMNESERSLVKRMQGKPFALLGVNGDEDRDKLKEWMKKEDITWRSWWDGGGNANTPGPISRQFNVHGWPTLYILDHRGVIRHKFLGFPGTSEVGRGNQHPCRGRGERWRRQYTPPTRKLKKSTLVRSAGFGSTWDCSLALTAHGLLGHRWRILAK